MARPATFTVCQLTICDRKHYARGRCRVHYSQLMNGGPRRIVGNDRARLAQYIEITADCWLWTGALDAAGYGYGTYRGRTTPAYRAVYEVWTKEVIPAGLVLDHLCRNTSCVRPDHLEPVTAAENFARGADCHAWQTSKTHCPQGHPYEGANLIQRKRGGRDCRECGRDASRRYYQRKKTVA